jgi:hypothetical protein
MESAFKFRWIYILLPVIILVLSVILTAWFYRLLPESVGWLFHTDGSVDKYAGAGIVVLCMLIPQLLLTLIAAGIVWGITVWGARTGQIQGAAVKPQTVLMFMGNMIALPQIILCFAMLDIFSYNSYQVHLLPLWVFIVIVAVSGGIVLGIFFIRAMWRVWMSSKE